MDDGTVADYIPGNEICKKCGNIQTKGWESCFRCDSKELEYVKGSDRFLNKEGKYVGGR